MATVFWDAKGVILLDFLYQRITNVIALPNSVHHSMKEILNQVVVFLHDSTQQRSHRRSDSLHQMEGIGSPVLKPRSCPIGLSPVPRKNRTLGTSIPNNAVVEQFMR
ncbi:hypothetical protein NPIL_686301 [Nephila pilipes]|uniref:Uncharacterized protein n=1 Tax=Nephila pilipes TaxID=299642 RepID=A0A8X6NYK4_NEPPI|nr:hypothetical protein NPIL_686301 [Nephila pilipes]